MNQGWYATTYGYDGADQLTSETGSGSYAPPTLGYTYDHNGNRLTQTSNGAQVQSFSYDAHDKLTSGTAGNEADGYDANGNETSVTIGGGTYRYTYDDEDRMTSLTLPNGTVDSFTYNELGLRTGKTDSTGIYAYLCDGTSPGSPVLSDGAALYTPGLSEYRGGASRYYSNDLLGNLWTIDASSKGQAYYQDTTGFGTLVAQAGSSSPFGYGGGNGCQTDADTGLILMGHRYYDTRIGRFISQDPIGDGDNWYAYADNSPTNEVDPEGLDAVLSFPVDGPGSSPVGSPGYADGAESGSGGVYTDYAETSVSLGHWTNGQPLDHTLEDENGDPYIANKYEGHTYWVGGSESFTPINPFDFDFQPADFFAKMLQKQINYQIRLHVENIQIALGMVKFNYGGIDPNKTVKEILNKKKASIKQAPLDKGSPSWQDIQNQKWEDIVKGAADRQPGYDTFRKLLTDGRFNK